MFWNDLRIYLRESLKLRRVYPEAATPGLLLRAYPSWRRSLSPGANPLRDRRPWITFAATDWLDGRLSSGMKVFEYGSGGSTLYFCARVGAVVSVEHDPDWAKRVEAALGASGSGRATVLVRPPVRDPSVEGADPADMDACVSSAAPYRGFSFRDYVCAIEEYPEGHFDLVVIDGRARPSCFRRAWTRVAPGGHIVWDNTERPHYAAAMARAPAGFSFRDFPGPSPHVRFFTRTSAWRRDERGGGG